MKKDIILFKQNNIPRSSEEIRTELSRFKNSYINTTHALIQDSMELAENGQTFVKNGYLVLSSFGMTRGGPFADKETTKATLYRCWEEIGEESIKIKKRLNQSDCARNRVLVEMERNKFESITNDIWDIMKRMLPFTMGSTSYGLVGASKLLFSIFPEIVLPIDNAQWLRVFQTVDIKDVIRWMASDILRWEQFTRERFNELDECIYNHC